jgi:hypothetical protein
MITHLFNRHGGNTKLNCIHPTIERHNFETLYRDYLPDVIHIQAELESHVSFLLEQLSGASVWQQDVPPPVQHQEYTTGNVHKEDSAQANNNQRLAARRSAWPTPAEGSHQQIAPERRGPKTGRNNNKLMLPRAQEVAFL